MKELYNELKRFAERINGDYITPRATELIEELGRIPGCQHEKNPRPYSLEEVLGVLDDGVVLDDWSEVETELTITYNVRTGFELSCKWGVLPPSKNLFGNKTINTGKGNTLDGAVCDLLEKMIAEKKKRERCYEEEMADAEREAAEWEATKESLQYFR